MALVKEERLGDALLLIYGAAAVAIPGLGHLWRGICVCVCASAPKGGQPHSPSSSCKGGTGGLMGMGFNSAPASA